MNLAKNLVINKKKINESLEVARKNIFFMTKVKSKNEILKNKIKN
jgi:hypothetical protein